MAVFRLTRQDLQSINSTIHYTPTTLPPPKARSAVPPTKALADRPNPPSPPSIYTSIPNILKAPQQPPTPLPWFHSLVRPIQIARSTMMIPSTYLFSATSRRAVCQRPVAKGPRKPPSVTELVYGTACVPAWPFGSQCNSPFLAHCTFDNSKPGRKLLIVFRVFKASGCGTVGYPFASFAGLGLFRFLLGKTPP